MWMIIVLKTTPKGDVPIVIEGENESPALFKTQAEALECTRRQVLCRAYSGWLLNIEDGDVEAY